MAMGVAGSFLKSAATGLEGVAKDRLQQSNLGQAWNALKPQDSQSTANLPRNAGVLQDNTYGDFPTAPQAPTAPGAPAAGHLVKAIRALSQHQDSQGGSAGRQQPYPGAQYDAYRGQE